MTVVFDEGPPHGGLRVERVDHPLLPLLLACDDEGAVACVSLGADPGPIDRHARGCRLEARAHDGARSPAARQLTAYLAGELRTFELVVRPVGTRFARACWAALLAIPYGQTRSYLDQARAIGRPRAVRAVGQANGRNPIPIVVPCHRVCGKDGTLVGFGGGLAAKRFLLDLEDPQRLLPAAIAG